MKIPKLQINAEHELQQRKLIEQQFDDEIKKASDELEKITNTKGLTELGASIVLTNVKINQLKYNIKRLIRTKNNWIKNGRKLFYGIIKENLK